VTCTITCRWVQSAEMRNLKRFWKDPRIMLCEYEPGTKLCGICTELLSIIDAFLRPGVCCTVPYTRRAISHPARPQPKSLQRFTVALLRRGKSHIDDPAQPTCCRRWMELRVEQKQEAERSRSNHPSASSLPGRLWHCGCVCQRLNRYQLLGWRLRDKPDRAQ
jgi:hypothetical protein